MTNPSDPQVPGAGSVVDVAEPLVREIHIRATPETVFEFFTDARKLTRWLAAEATLDPRPGGVCHQEHPANGDGSGGTYHMRGEFLEVSRPGRVVFTWGFTNPDVGVPPGSSVVDVTLTPEGDGTRLRLEHRDLPAAEIESHAGGWTGMLERLATAVVTPAGDGP
jgi:uncharacterized protein YndB with AHSA1/START domain